MKPADSPAPADNTPPAVDVPDYRPLERFWPYTDLPEQPTDEEMARLDPVLSEVLFGSSRRPFSVSLEFPPFAGPNYPRAVELARQSADYLELGAADRLRHRARFHSSDALELRTLFEIVGPVPGCEVLIDDRPVPNARELWLPLLWFLI